MRLPLRPPRPLHPQHFHRTFASRRIPIPISPLPNTINMVQQTPQCPPPTCAPCACNPTNLDIDRTTPLLGTMPRFQKHVVISTGKRDWASRIELDGGDGGLAGKLKTLLKKRGDPRAPTLITNSSFPEGEEGGSIRVFPDGLYFPSLPTDDNTLESFAAAYLLNESSESTSLPQPPQKITHPTILICSHNSRDNRCGQYYPPLREEFDDVLKRKGLKEVEVAGSSHLSGHKWAGNVVVYLPGEGEEEGWGVWYGRVGVEQVEGIVEETVVKRRVLGDHVRGVVGREIE
ncbi:Sucrase/ferredoxin-like-domain-containing protein [Trichophaea hybrida]|nr:Sucrase/ferredoxin-like-domain-containing protein [Trichophaea hybrida]